MSATWQREGERVGTGRASFPSLGGNINEPASYLPPRRVVRINNLGLMGGLNMHSEMKKLPISISLGYLGIIHKLSTPKGPERLLDLYSSAHLTENFQSPLGLYCKK